MPKGWLCGPPELELAPYSWTVQTHEKQYVKGQLITGTSFSRPQAQCNSSKTQDEIKITGLHAHPNSVLHVLMLNCLLRRRVIFIGLALSLARTCPVSATELTNYATEFKRLLESQVLPYWYDTGQDMQHGGYLLADDGRGNRQATEKHLVSQARMMWTFSHVWLKGYRDTNRNYLTAAARGFRFLQKHFRDPVYGGYFWKTDVAGNVTDDRKILYGQAFAIYALVEYHRASGEPEPLQAALELYRLIQRHAHDPDNGGWLEHFERNWQPILDPNVHVEVEVAGCKSANTHLHLMEAFAELGAVTRDAEVIRSLVEALRINQQHFYPTDPARACAVRQLDWQPLPGPNNASLSYGHNVEFAWLMIRAENVLGRAPSWDHFNSYLGHALKYGADSEFGGLFYRGPSSGPATVQDKVWWVQAEWLAALTETVQRKPDPDYIAALEKTTEFVLTRQAAHDGIWFDTVTRDGQPKDTRKAHNWKANYHDVRALVKFIEAFLPGSGQAPKEPDGLHPLGSLL